MGSPPAPPASVGGDGTGEEATVALRRPLLHPPPPTPLLLLFPAGLQALILNAYGHRLLWEMSCISNEPVGHETFADVLRGLDVSPAMLHYSKGIFQRVCPASGWHAEVQHSPKKAP